MGVLDLPEYELNEDENIKVEKIISKYRGIKNALIPVLQEMQDSLGFLPLNVQRKVAEGLDVPEKDVYG
ncbi:MAG: NAD(P)H-dependent oxidoreductase subunit E, partial [Actinomycetia bacterium]|nr:NAD(P)H-dependent oxidoreductase subunit E [Actinomycetes bacterium]